MSTTYNVIGFGEFREHTLPWVLFNAPNYFYLGAQRQVWSRHEHLHRQAERIDHLSRHITIPGNEDGLYQIHYLVPKSRRVLRNVQVLHRSEEPRPDSVYGPLTVDLISNVIDLSYAAYLDPYDYYYGPRRILEVISDHYNGPLLIDWPEEWPIEWSEGYFPDDGIWAEEWCQQFFSDDRNFHESARIGSSVHHKRR